jgi:hypothetical protein
VIIFTDDESSVILLNINVISAVEMEITLLILQKEEQMLLPLITVLSCYVFKVDS